MGVHEQFDEELDKFSFPKALHDLFAVQVKKLIADDQSNSAETKRLLSREINELTETYDKMEFRYATNEISKEIFDR